MAKKKFLEIKKDHKFKFTPFSNLNPKLEKRVYKSTQPLETNPSIIIDLVMNLTRKEIYN